MAINLRTSTNLRTRYCRSPETPPRNWTTDVIVFGYGCILTVAVQYHMVTDQQRQPINCLLTKASPGPDNRTKRIAPEITTFAKDIKPTSKPCCTVKQWAMRASVWSVPPLHVCCARPRMVVGSGRLGPQPGNAKLCRAMYLMNLVLANAAMIFQLVYVRDNRSA